MYRRYCYIACTQTNFIASIPSFLKKNKTKFVLSQNFNLVGLNWSMPLIYLRICFILIKNHIFKNIPGSNNYPYCKIMVYFGINQNRKIVKYFSSTIF